MPRLPTSSSSEPVVASVTDEEIEELTALVNAVWHRICASDYDTSAFETSKLKDEALAFARRGDARSRALQDAYERWLVEGDRRTHGDE